MVLLLLRRVQSLIIFYEPSASAHWSVGPVSFRWQLVFGMADAREPFFPIFGWREMLGACLKRVSFFSLGRTMKSTELQYQQVRTGTDER
jgi:hypothetical protein